MQPIKPSPRVSTPARPLCLTGEPHLSAQPRAPTLPRSLAAQWTQPVGASYFTRSLSLSLSVSWAWFASRRAVAAHVPFSLFALWACLVRSAFLAPAVDQRVRTCACRRISRPRRPPMRPAPFLEPRQCPAHTPHLISCSFTLSRALPTPPAAAGDPHPRSWPSSSPETAPSLPELCPEVRRRPHAQFPLLRNVFVQFRLRRCSTAAVHRARAVVG
jgi:hypothetical protein